MIGTTRNMSDSGGTGVSGATYTAFGERASGSMGGPGERYGYAGAWGYQADEDLPFLHVGHRYYDPARGRFLQRDPIGIRGRMNVYEYVGNTPTSRIDPTGLYDRWRLPPWTLPPALPPTPRGPVEIMEEVKDAGTGKSDDWHHFMVSCRVCKENYAGAIYVLPGGLLKELLDQLDRNRPPLSDSLSDMWANIRGWWVGMSPTSCAAAANANYP